MRYIKTYEKYNIYYEYQYREVVDTYYKRVRGQDIWEFTTKSDYDINSDKDGNKIINWNDNN